MFAHQFALALATLITVPVSTSAPLEGPAFESSSGSAVVTLAVARSDAPTALADGWPISSLAYGPRERLQLTPVTLIGCAE